MNSKIFLRILSLSIVLLASASAFAQQGGFDMSNFDPAMIQKRILDGYRSQLDITNEVEWTVVQGRIQKLLDARRAATPSPGGMGGLGGMAAMFGGARREAPPREAAGGERQQRANSFLNQFLPQPSPEEETLKKAVDAKAPKDEIKAALAKLHEARKQKQAALEKAQSDLREVLTVQQEAVATLSGLL